MESSKYPYLIPVTIIIAGIIIAVAVFMVRTSNPNSVGIVRDVSALRPVSTADHIVGNPKAKVVIVEYSDIDCEYCKTFEATMTQIMTEYGPSSDVAWVYRHFPIVSLRGFSAEHAEAAECVASLGGNTAFFHFINRLQQSSPGGSQFDPAGYESVVKSLGLSASEFTSCRESNRMVSKVTADFENALTIGADVTPYSVLLVEGKAPVPISGSVPYEGMKQIIEEALK